MKNIPLFKVFMNADVMKPLSEVLLSGYIGQGQKVEEFERILKTHFNVDYLMTVNSATSAEHLALHLLKMHKNNDFPGLEEGDEVLTTALTCTATNWPILANGLKIKWVDIDAKTLNIDLDDLSRKLTNKTKIIYVVHWGGYPVYLDRLKEIQNKAFDMFGFRPMIIEDCAHAMGSNYMDQPIGSHGNICTFSFQAIKHFTTGDGGALIVPTADLYKRGKLQRWYGINRDDNRKDFRCEADIEEWGFKFHMNDINATIGLSNYPLLQGIINKHKSNGQFFDKELKNASVELLERNSNTDSAFWIYSMLVDDKMNFMRKMKEYGITTSQVHERNDQHTCTEEFVASLPTLDRILPKMINIPVGWWVTSEDREYIVDCIKKGW